MKTKMRIFNKVFGIVLAICMALGSLLCVDINCSASEPKVMIIDYKVNPSEIKPGDSFSLSITLQNTANKRVKNMKVSILSEDGSILPDGSAGTTYISELAAETTEDIAFDMKAVAGLSEKSYKLTVRMEYEDTYDDSYTVEDTLYVPITLPTRISVTELMISPDSKIGDDAEITAVVNNMGDATVKNVIAYVEGKSIEAQSIYLGNIEPGKSGTIDLLTRTRMVTTSAPEAKGTLRIVYEDSLGNSHEEEQEIYVYVRSTSFENLEVLKETKDTGVNKNLIIIIAIAVLAAALLVVKIIKLRKKKKQLEDF